MIQVLVLLEGLLCFIQRIVSQKLKLTHNVLIIQLFMFAISNLQTKIESTQMKLCKMPTDMFNFGSYLMYINMQDGNATYEYTKKFSDRMFSSIL